VRVGRYGVDVEALERVGLEAVRRALETGRVVVIDEIGKMEMASPAFCEIVARALDSPSPVLATIHAHPHPFTDAIKRRPDVRLFELTPANRDGAEGVIWNWLTVR
jgi:nucleoside-triphosphatase